MNIKKLYFELLEFLAGIVVMRGSLAEWLGAGRETRQYVEFISLILFLNMLSLFLTYLP